MSRYKLQISLVLLTLILVSGLLAPWIAPYDPNATAMKERLLGPCARHWLGTDKLNELARFSLYGHIIATPDVLCTLQQSILHIVFI